MSWRADGPDGKETGWAVLDGDRVVADRLTRADAERIAGLGARIQELEEALRFALSDSGCDGDLCAHGWHALARAALAKGTNHG